MVGILIGNPRLGEFGGFGNRKFYGGIGCVTCSFFLKSVLQCNLQLQSLFTSVFSAIKDLDRDLEI